MPFLSFRSPPAQNAFSPDPVKIIALILSGDIDKSSIIDVNSFDIIVLKALANFGLLKVTNKI